MTTVSRIEAYFAEPDECRQCPYVNPCVGPPPPRQRSPRISRATAIDCVYRGLIPEGNIEEILGSLESQVRSAADAKFGPGIGRNMAGGLSNARGEWLENILGLVFWNAAARESGGRTAIVKLPNANQLRFHNLFEPRSREYLEQLFESLAEDEIAMEMSNPDFICVTNLPDELTPYFSSELTMSSDTLEKLSSSYRMLAGKCDVDAMPFVLTVKTSTRPDRRYQMVHEANVVKTLMAHLAGRFWNRHLQLKFYVMVAGRVSDSDRKVLRNPATYSLVHVSWPPVALIDGVFELGTVSQVENTIQELMT